MGSNYPPGTSAGDPNAPWNAPDPPKCPDCEHRIVDPDDHADDCPDGDADAVEVRERQEDLQRRRGGKDPDAVREEQQFQERQNDDG